MRHQRSHRTLPIAERSAGRPAYRPTQRTSKMVEDESGLGKCSRQIFEFVDLGLQDVGIETEMSFYELGNAFANSGRIIMPAMRPLAVWGRLSSNAVMKRMREPREACRCASRISPTSAPTSRSAVVQWRCTRPHRRLYDGSPPRQSRSCIQSHDDAQPIGSRRAVMHPTIYRYGS